MEKKIPSYRKHASGQAYIRIGDKQLAIEDAEPDCTGDGKRNRPRSFERRRDGS